MGRLTTVTDSLGNSRQIVYEAAMNRKLADVDALGNGTMHLYDGSNRLSTITLAIECLLENHGHGQRADSGLTNPSLAAKRHGRTPT